MVNPNVFESAYLRTERGRELLVQLENLCGDVCNEYADKLAGFYPSRLTNAQAIIDLIDSRHPDPNIPPGVAIRVGEIVYNFRAALDYMACELASLDSPSLPAKRRNQFPIERTRRVFGSRRSTFLAGISDPHVAIIERYQPFAGCRWTARLAELSNRDKHNDLILVAQGLKLTLQAARDEGSSHNLTISFHLSLGADEHDVAILPMLQRLGSHVAAVLDTFSRGEA